MAETKNFLSLTGLQSYDAKIKALIKSQGKDVTDKLIDLIGAASKGADTKTILARVADLETAVGNVQNLPGEVKELVAAIVGESTRAQAAETSLGNRLNVIEGEAEVEGSIKKALADAKIYADGKDAAIAAAKKAGDDAQKDVDALEAKVGAVTEGKTVVQMISEAQTAATYDDTQVKADIAANTSNISDLTTRMSTAEGEIDTLQTDMIAVKTKAAANESAIGILNGEGEGSVKKQIDAAFNDFATKISDDGVVNTYKELVDYCATHSADAAKMAGDIKTNATAISELETFVGTLPEGTSAATVIAYINEKVAKEEDRTTKAIEALDANLSQNAGADGLALSITEVDGKITAISGSIAAETYDAHGAAKAVQGETAKTVKELEDDLAAFTEISESQIDALFTTVNA